MELPFAVAGGCEVGLGVAEGREAALNAARISVGNLVREGEANTYSGYRTGR